MFYMLFVGFFFFLFEKNNKKPICFIFKVKDVLGTYLRRMPKRFRLEQVLITNFILF